MRLCERLTKLQQVVEFHFQEEISIMVLFYDRLID